MQFRTIKNQGRQGDVCITRLDNMDHTSKEKLKKHFDFENIKEINTEGDFITLVEGEASGHHHGFSKKSKVEVFAVKTTQDGINAFKIIVHAPSIFKHVDFNKKNATNDFRLTKEHGSQRLLPGEYLVTTQRNIGDNRLFYPVTD